MEGRTPEADPRRLVSELLRTRTGVLVERWERRVLEDPLMPEERRPSEPALRAYVPDLIGRLAARLQVAAGDCADVAVAGGAWASIRVSRDLGATLGEISHLRAAIAELCADEGVALAGEAALCVHAALDEAMAAVASVIERGARAAWEHERERLDLILRLLPVGVFITDASGRFVTMNEASRRIWGEQAPLVQGLESYGAYRAFRPGGGEALAPGEWGLVRALQGDAVHDEDVEIVSFDGERKTIVNYALALRDADGAITGGVAVNVDVTDRRRTERGLAAIIEGALDAIVLIDATGRVTEFNPAAERIFGHARGDAIGRELAELVIEPSLREAHRRGLRRYLATGEARILGRRMEMRALRADGTLFDTELTVIRLPPGGDALFAGFVRDITDVKRAELERTRETEFRERFIGVLGHDLRTPLGAIHLAAQWLLAQGEVGETEVRALRRIVKSSDRMERMIRDLLDFARSRQNSGFPVTPAPGDLAVICRQVLDEIKLTHPGRVLELCRRGDASGEWDVDRIAQVVQNLVVNALDYSPSDSKVEVTLEDAGEHVVLSVRNVGPAIPPELLAQLFDPFRRVAQASASRGGARGLGLGLYIAHAIVSAHHGRIEVESDDANGTTFSVVLPRALAQAA